MERQTIENLHQVQQHFAVYPKDFSHEARPGHKKSIAGAYYIESRGYFAFQLRLNTEVLDVVREELGDEPWIIEDWAEAFPEDLQDELCEARSAAEHATVAIKAIDRFIQGVQ